MTEIQQMVQAAADEVVGSGAERGVQVAVYRHGEQVADVVAGVADPDTGRPVTPDTLFHVTSTGKGVTSTVLHTLVEAGILTYDTPIVDLWPEFGANGKQPATVRHALTHATGVPAVPAGTTPEDLCDWARMCDLIANATPWWEPGTATGYHPQTYGYLIGEIVRRATGKTISEVLRERVSVPLGVERELFFAVPSDDLERVARAEDAHGAMAFTPEMAAAMAEQVPFFRVRDGWTAAPLNAMPDAAFCNRVDVLTSDIPAGAVVTARAIARMYAALLAEVGGVRLVGDARLREITTVAVNGTDEVVGFPASRGLGYDIGFPGPLDSPTLFGMAGSGGTAAYADTATGVVVAVAKNRVTAGDFTTFHAIGAAVAKALGEEER